MNTKIKIGVAVAALLLARAGVGAATIAGWTFETNTPADLSNSKASPTVSAEIGSGTARGFHASDATDWTTPSGNGSANSFSVNTWASGDYFEFQVSTIGFTDIAIAWDQTSSSTGPTAFELSYSTNGVSFTSIGTYTVITSTGTNIVYSDLTTGSSWSSSKTATNTSFSYDLSSITGLDQQSTVYFRLTTSSSPASTGTGRVDNVMVTATAIPEPSACAVVLGGIVLAGVVVRRRRQVKVAVV